MPGATPFAPPGADAHAPAVWNRCLAAHDLGGYGLHGRVRRPAERRYARRLRPTMSETPSPDPIDLLTEAVRALDAPLSVRLQMVADEVARYVCSCAGATPPLPKGICVRFGASRSTRKHAPQLAV